MMRRPTSIGDYIRYVYLEETGSNVTELADKLGISRQMLTRLMHNDNPAHLTPQMALKFEAVFGGTAETWLAMSAGYELYNLRKSA